MVAHGIVEVPVQGGTIHGRPIPEGYARVMVDQVEPGWEDLDLEIPGGDGEEELGHAMHTWICWNKRYTWIYLRGHINGKPVSRMLVDSGAIVNLMHYSLYKKLGGMD